MQKITITVSTIDGDNNFVPYENLEQSDFKFIKASDNVTEVGFTGFSDNGNGNYTFWSFAVDTFESINSSSYPERIDVRLKINNVFQDSYGIITVYRDDRQPVGKGYVDGRVDRGVGGQNPNDGADTIFGLVQYDGTVTLGDVVPTDGSLIHKQYADGRYGRLGSSNVWTGATNQFEAGLFHDTVYLEDVVTGQDFQMETLSNLYLGVEEPANNNLVWKKWIIDHYGTSGSPTGFPINANRLIVDSKASSNIAGKIYQTIQGAISYASSQVPSASSKWVIYILPHHSTGYNETVTLIRFCDLVGLGSVVLTGTFTSTAVTGAQTWTNYDSRIENLVLSTIDKDIYLRQLRIKDCQFRANGAGGEVNLILDGSELLDCGIYLQNDVNIEVNNTTKINRVKGTYGNTNIIWLSTDKVYSYNFDTTDQWEF